MEIDTFSPDDVGVFLNAVLQVEPVDQHHYCMSERASGA